MELLSRRRVIVWFGRHREICMCQFFCHPRGRNTNTRFTLMSKQALLIILDLSILSVTHPTLVSRAPPHHISSPIKLISCHRWDSSIHALALHDNLGAPQ